MTKKKPYHGWLIEVVPQQIGYTFQCWLPNEMVGVSDYQTYPNLESAFVAAQKRADLEAVRLALRHCQSTLHCGDLDFEEYLTLADLILGVAPSHEKAVEPASG